MAIYVCWWWGTIGKAIGRLDWGPFLWLLLTVLTIFNLHWPLFQWTTDSSNQGGTRPALDEGPNVKLLAQQKLNIMKIVEMRHPADEETKKKMGIMRTLEAEEVWPILPFKNDQIRA
jgi:hypothetical protein